MKVYNLTLVEPEGDGPVGSIYQTEASAYRSAAMAIRNIWEDDLENPFMGSTENATMRRYCSDEDYAENLPKVRDMMAREQYREMVDWWVDFGHNLDECPMYVYVTEEEVKP